MSRRPTHRTVGAVNTQRLNFTCTPQESLPPRRKGAPPLCQFTCPNFSQGREITYTLVGGVFWFQVAGEPLFSTEGCSYPQAAAIARTKYGVPFIGCQQMGGVA